MVLFFYFFFLFSSLLYIPSSPDSRVYSFSFLPPTQSGRSRRPGGRRPGAHKSVAAASWAKNEEKGSRWCVAYLWVRLTRLASFAAASRWWVVRFAESRGRGSWAACCCRGSQKNLRNIEMAKLGHIKYTILPNCVCWMVRENRGSPSSVVLKEWERLFRWMRLADESWWSAGGVSRITNYCLGNVRCLWKFDVIVEHICHWELGTTSLAWITNLIPRNSFDS